LLNYVSTAAAFLARSPLQKYAVSQWAFPG
jgi:hypothetical protein